MHPEQSDEVQALISHLPAGTVITVEYPADKTNVLFSDSPIEIRHAFISKVYVWLFLHSLVVLAIAAPIAYLHPHRWLIDAEPWIVIGVLVFNFVLLMILACVPSLIWKSPVNCIMSAFFTVGTGLLVGAATFGPLNSILVWAGTVALAILVLKIFAVQTRYDFLSFRPYLVATLLIVIALALTLRYLPDDMGFSPISGTITLVVTFYLIGEVQYLVSGKGRHHPFGIEDHGAAAIYVYVDLLRHAANILLKYWWIGLWMELINGRR